MTGHYLGLRFRQFWRFFTFNQFNPIAGILLLTAAFLIASTAIFLKVSHPDWVYALLGLLTVVQLQSARSNAFLKSIMGDTALFKMKLAENAVIALPFLAVLLFHQAFLPAVCLCLLLLPYSRFNFTVQKQRVTTLPSPFLSYSFEFNAGFRIYALVFILYIVLLTAGIVSRNFYVFLLPFFITLFFQSSFYGYIEAPFYIWVYRKTASGFLISKLRSLFINFAITNALFVLSGLIFYPQQWDSILLAALTGLLALTGSMFIKYQFYPSELFIQISQMVFFGAAVAGMLNPVFLIAALLFLLFSFIKAKQKLKPLLC